MLFVVLIIIMACVLLTVSWRVGRPAREVREFFVGSRCVSSGFLALSQASNAVPLWLLLGVSWAAYEWGFAAVWVLLTAVLGHLVGWLYIAPRVREWSLMTNRLTLAHLLTEDVGIRMRGPVVLSAGLILFVSVLLGMAAYLPMLGERVAEWLPVSPRSGMLMGLALATLTALLGGFRGACINDSLRAAAVLLVCLVVAVCAVIAAGGWVAVWTELSELPADAGLWTGEEAVILAVTFVLGTLTLFLPAFGQPQIISRFIALNDAHQVVTARRSALVYTLLVLGSMLVCGWAARVLVPEVAAGPHVFVALLERVLPGALSVVAGAVLIVVAFTMLENVLLAMAASVSVDVKRPGVPLSLDWPKPAIVLAAALLAVVAIEAPESTFERLLLSWSLLGSAFVPLLLVRLSGKRVRPGSTLGSMWAGFVLTLLLHLLPSAPGDFLERALPFVAALGIALTGGERRRDPDRADRAQGEVHPGEQT